MEKYKDKILIIGAGVAGINAATKLINNSYPGELITIIDKGKDPYNRLPEEVMEGFAGAGLFSDGKYCYLSNDDLFTLAMNIAFSGDTEAYKRWYFEYNEKTKGDPNYVDIFAAYLVCNVGYDVSGACALICLTDEKLEK